MTEITFNYETYVLFYVFRNNTTFTIQNTEEIKS